MKLAKYLKPYTLFAIISPLLMMGEVLADLCLPYLMSFIVDYGIAEDGLAKIDGGMLELKAAAAMLSQQKTAGLLEISAAANELAVSGSQVTAALTQIEGGIDTLEQTREQTLQQADLNNMLTLEMLTGILTARFAAAISP